MISLFQTSSEKRGFILDPRTIFFIMLTIVLFVVGDVAIIPEYMVMALTVLPILLLLFSGNFKKAIMYIIIFALAELFLMYGIGHVYDTLEVIIVMICVMITRILPALIMGAYIFSTTTVSEFIASMDRMKITKKISIPLAIMFRFFPTVVEEFVAINNAMKMRDIRFGGKNSAKIVEYRLVPLIICSVNIGNELSAASLTRGLSAYEDRTNICEIGFKLQDFIAIILMIVPYLAWMKVV